MPSARIARFFLCGVIRAIEFSESNCRQLKSAADVEHHECVDGALADFRNSFTGGAFMRLHKICVAGALAMLLSAGSVLAGSISVNNNNGKTVVVYNGQEVWSGETSGKVSAKCVTENGKEYAAARDGEKVLWENVPGAADHVKKEGSKE
jgi:hypothetical protein